MSLSAALACAGLLTTATGVTAARLRWWSVVAWLVASALWLWFDRPVEGAVLVVVTPGRGVTFADLAVPAAALVIAIAHLVRAQR